MELLFTCRQYVGQKAFFTYIARADRERLEPGSGALSPVYHTTLGAESPEDLLLATVVLKPHMLPEHTQIQDIRQRGGGLKPSISRASGQALWDEGPLDGDLYQKQGVVVVQVSEEGVDKSDNALS